MVMVRGDTIITWCLSTPSPKPVVVQNPLSQDTASDSQPQGEFIPVLNEKGAKLHYNN